MTVDKTAFKPIEGFPGYFISKHGEVRSQRTRAREGLDPTRWSKIKHSKDRDGYPIVSLRVNGSIKTRFIHRLLLQAFVGPCPPGMEARHLDDVKSNFKLSNLKWGTHLENIRDRERNGGRTPPRGSGHSSSKLTESDVRKIRRLIASGKSLRAIARMYGVCNSTISELKQGRTWAHLK